MIFLVKDELFSIDSFWTIKDFRKNSCFYKNLLKVVDSIEYIYLENDKKPIETMLLYETLPINCYKVFYKKFRILKKNRYEYFDYFYYVILRR